MKNTKKLFALVLCALLILSLCACGADSVSEETVAPTESNAEYSGTYNAFGIDYEDHITALGDDRSIELTLNEDGTGSMRVEDASSQSEGDIETWKVEDGKLTITVNGRDASGPIKDGVIELTISGTDDTVTYFAKEGVDISSYDVRE